MLIKCTDLPKSYYELIGFEEIKDNDSLLDLAQVRKHYDEISHEGNMYYFVLHSNKVINYKMKAFINHVEQFVDDIDYSSVYESYLFLNIHQVYADSKLYMQMIGKTSNLFQNSEDMFIPIGQVIERLFEEMKPVGFDHFLKLYEFMFSNLI